MPTLSLMVVLAVLQDPTPRLHAVPDSLPGCLWSRPAESLTQPFLFLSGPAEVAGIKLETGRYILMTVPGPDRWTILLNTSTAPTPVQMFSALVEVGRGQVPVERLDSPVERLTITAGTGAELALLLEWEHVRVRLPVGLRR